jgi:hypothetical protein
VSLGFIPAASSKVMVTSTPLLVNSRNSSQPVIAAAAIGTAQIQPGQRLFFVTAWVRCD